MKALISLIQSKIKLEASDIKQLHTLFQGENQRAKTFLLKADTPVHFIYFLVEGIVKGYRYEVDKAVIEHLVEAGNFFTALDSFMQNVPSLEYFETVTDCRLLKVSKSQFSELLNQDKKWEHFFNEITQESLVCKMNRLKDFQTLTAKQRYQKLLTNQPQLALEVSVADLSSYLGIAAPSLSRIRGELAN